MPSSRRTLLQAGLASGAVALTVPSASARADFRPSVAAPPQRTDPFSLGVASGDPLPDGFVIWTRLAPSPLADDGRGGMPNHAYQVGWQVATDEQFRRVEARGTVAARPERGHATHVEVEGLRPGREYYYRFRIGRWTSPVGRAITTPAINANATALTMAVASCSQYEHGLFTVYRRLAEDHPDLVLHLGDYVYEPQKDVYVIDGGNIRDHKGPETETLANYRQRHAQYKSDPDLQAAHAAAPWLVVWDDHEVDNNWADDVYEKPEIPQPNFAKRRAAAAQAYYENMPLRRSSVPEGVDMQLYRRLRWGRLANLHLLDTRQYRDDQACGDGMKNCEDAERPERSLPGMKQEKWLLDGFRKSRARWDLIGQQVFFGRRDSRDPEPDTVSMDSWDGYPASRQRITQGWVDAKVRNPVVLTGDVHAHWASDLYLDYAEQDRPVGSELITSSVTSGGNGYDEPRGKHPWAEWNPNIRFWTNLRGYVRTKITQESMTAEFRCVPQVSSSGAEAFTRSTFVIEDGKAGLQETKSTRAPSSARGAPQDPKKIIRDTLRQEGH